MSINREIPMYSIDDVLSVLKRVNSDDAYAFASELTALSEDTLSTMTDKITDKKPEDGLHHIEITCEVTTRRSYDMVVDNETYEKVCGGDMSKFEYLFDKTLCSAFWDVTGTDVETDYAIYDLDEEKQVVDWD